MLYLEGMNVRLKPEDLERVRDLVASGAYGDEADVMSAALAALDERDRERKLEWLRARVAEGRKDFEEGRYTELRTDEEIDAFFDAL